MNTPLPPILEAKLAEFRRRVWIVKLAEGLLAALFGIVLSYLLVFALDRFLETPSWLRLTLLLAGALTLGLGLPLKWHQWVWRQRRLEDAARLLRRTFPRLGDQLLGLVELARMDHIAAGRSDRLVQAAMEQAADSVKDRDFRQAVPDARHKHWGWAATGAVAAALAAFLAVNEAARNAFSRWIAPWREVERFTFARVEPLPDSMVVPYAEPFELPVRLAANTQMSPSSASARIGKQPAVNAALFSQAYPFSFPPQKEESSLALSLGDIRKTIAILPRPRPELSELAVRIQLPGYLQYKSEQRTEVRGGSTSIVKGAKAAVEAKATNSLVSAEMDGKPQRAEGNMIASEFLQVEQNTERKLTWKDRDGLTPRDPLVLRVYAVDDEAPRIAARRESLEQVVLDSEVVNFDLTASDDFGIKRAGLEWTGVETNKTFGEKIAFGGSPEKKEIAAPATFCAQREGAAPGTYEVRAWADDYFPNRRRTTSASFILHVLDKTDHALWVTTQMGKWLEAARETYEREQHLHQTNKELRALSAAELERPENRRRVSQQAAAENANAGRLEHLTQAGKNLVEQATKNDEFDAERLESWATMLKSLKDIAGNRMPSVADLLKQTASASGANAGKPSPGQPSVAKPAASPNATETPKLSDNEANSGKMGDNSRPSEKPPGAPKFGLPTTTLGAAKPNGEEQPKAPESPAQEKMDQAIREQRDLLAEFAKVSDQLNEILASLEASTFVKRFKAASKKQMTMATDISQKTLDAFGIERNAVEAAVPILQTAKEQSEVVHVIQSDLEAYFQRKQDSRFENILDQMKEMKIVQALGRGGERISTNLNGQAMAGSEYWADIMDRWAEELVAASNCKSCSSCSGDSLPPEIVLKVMQALRDEMKLRDETRETENAKPALELEKFTANAQGLGAKQADIEKHTSSAIDDILALPEGAARFAKELNLLNAVVEVMNEAEGILGTPETGATAVAAETEAIELLLQARRMNPNGGGGGGSNPGGGGTAAKASSVALTDIGPGADADSIVDARPVGQATGRAGKEFPGEFKSGLDTYFNLLEGQNLEK